jgi:hypothetical protein
MDITGFYGSGVRHAWVRNADDDVADIDAIITVGGETENEETEIPGDDAIKSTVRSAQKIALTVEGNSLSFAAHSILTGNAVVQTPADTSPVVAQSASIAGGTDSELNAPFVEIGAVTVGKTAEGENAYMVRTFHKCQAGPISTEQGNGSEQTWAFDGYAYPTSVDIEGEALASKRIDTRKVVIGNFVDNGGAY